MAIIGVFDSGIGGLSILKAIVDKSPLNRFVYLADTLNAPYGDKSKADIIEYTKDCCDKLILRGADIIVLACNTATSGAIDEIRAIYEIPIIGTEPSITPALRDNCNKILVMATPYTLDSDRYHSLVKDKGDIIVNLSCGNLAIRIEEVAPYFDKLEHELVELLTPYKDCDGIVLGCTHYAIIKAMIEQIMPQSKVYTSAKGIANRIVEVIGINQSEEDDSCIHMLSTSNLDMTGYIELYNRINDY